MNINALLSSPEGKTLEFKRNLSSSKPILKTLVAFANTTGGTLIIGRADDGETIGVDNALADEERLANPIADSMAGRDVNSEALKERWGITIRTAERDIADLRKKRRLNLSEQLKRDVVS